METKQRIERIERLKNALSDPKKMAEMIEGADEMIEDLIKRLEADEKTLEVINPKRLNR